VGIATGPVIFGVLGSKDRRTLSVTGHPVNLAARLEGRAASGEILIDGATHDALKRDRSGQFVATTMKLKGIARSTTAYRWISDHDN
jgi:adenylate cyclase